MFGPIGRRRRPAAALFAAAALALSAPPHAAAGTQAPPNAAAAFAAARLETPDAPDLARRGAAILRIIPGRNDVQTSNYGNRTFSVTNTGEKRIAAVYLDVARALYPDAVFDPDGRGGDTAFLALSIGASGGTEIRDPRDYPAYHQPTLHGSHPLYRRGVAPRRSDGGYRGLLLVFATPAAPGAGAGPGGGAPGGFEPGETARFGLDMDPHSVAGFRKKTIDARSSPPWDAGGVSGAELIGSEITVLFADGAAAMGQLMGDGSQAGAQALIDEGAPGLVAEVSVNGFGPGEQGTYGAARPRVVVSGPSGHTVRVVMTRGAQPVANTEHGAGALVSARLAGAAFPANNAVEFQFVDVALGSAETTRDISDRFDYSAAPNGYAFPGSDALPLGFTASVVDPRAEHLPLGPVAAPVYLTNLGGPVRARR